MAEARQTVEAGITARVEPRLKLWLEGDGGRLVFSEYRMALLQHIDETGSLAAAAERMGLSYRRAWGKIKEIESNLGVRLVESEAGGGHTRLTDSGREMVERFRLLRARLQADLEREFQETFS